MPSKSPTAIDNLNKLPGGHLGLDSSPYGRHSLVRLLEMGSLPPSCLTTLSTIHYNPIQFRFNSDSIQIQFRFNSD
ncbi:hypothetical protein VN97_g12273, partial [Penicillium thymicola]